MVKNKLGGYLIITWSGERSKALPPIVKETLGIEDRLLQSTADSPIGLGILSQSYSWKQAVRLDM